MRKKPQIDIFEYHDYREFLSHMFKYQKQVNNISLRSIASQAETTAANLSMILKAKRKLSNELAQNIASVLNFNKQQENYLLNLIILNDSNNISDKYKAYQKMKRNYAYQDGHAKSLESFKYLSDWYNVVIRELVATEGFKWDARYIQKKLPKKIPLKSIKLAMDFLVRNDFVEISNGLAKIDKELDCVGGIYKLSLSKFHDEMMGITVDSIYEVESHKRCILGHTVALSKDDFHKATELLNDTLNEIKKLGDEDQSKEHVYHFILSTIPVTR
ncbi:TIGR02147 family protein [Halobacteriovorax sp. XZX-3]|uniref:TIGR02147 family protein n=1 Tax=unclassified Halobacteriovorax TaxID=2639665 RepID=UPI0037196FFC